MKKTQGRMRLTNVILVLAICAQGPAYAQTKTSKVVSSTSQVPFVGCKSDGQMGPVRAPKAKTKTLPITTEAAQRLVYYASSHGLGVLAPPGWNCFGTYGSNGDALYVSPEPVGTEILFSKDWKGFKGPAIQLSRHYGDTSGRFDVARVIARVFPERKAFVDNVIRERLQPASSFPFGPYPKDKLTQKNKRMIEYETPAHAEGLGTHTRLLKGDRPISGVVILTGEAPDLLDLAVRLPPEQAELVPVIVQEVERRSPSKR